MCVCVCVSDFGFRLGFQTWSLPKILFLWRLVDPQLTIEQVYSKYEYLNGLVMSWLVGGSIARFSSVRSSQAQGPDCRPLEEWKDFMICTFWALTGNKWTFCKPWSNFINMSQHGLTFSRHETNAQILVMYLSDRIPILRNPEAPSWSYTTVKMCVCDIYILYLYIYKTTLLWNLNM